ncbi:MAG: hypothetical protein Sv326_1194 [Candidatus Fermentimicrarchaeum limneticum]|uniref:His-Xaa-Ser system protein HxsD n=1 Tax=Fermentimicrarchaeum limneticum TaxID=2795018 RepID=A0A7D5XKL8_FERL1|nr:MAG: hypothetical protein Sv326_1194 [Candidatus Fermentimicrarchaeum limneticum]
MTDSPKNVQYLKDRVLFSINPKIYPLEVVHSAAYALIDKAYVMLDGDPNDEIIAELKPKNKGEIREVVTKFAEELLNYAVYYNQSRMNKGVREMIIGRVFSTNIQASETTQEKDEKCDEIADPLGIAKPWTPPKKKR